jgi:hypothetical protein
MSNDIMDTNEDLARIYKAVAIAYLQVLSQQVPGTTEETAKPISSLCAKT